MNDLTPSMAPQNASPEALPAPWIDRLFGRFATLYGRHWAEMWNGIPMPQVAATWAEALSGCTAEEIRKGLQHISQHEKFPPTAPEFVAICRTFRIRPSNLQALSPPRSASEIDPRVRSEIARLLAAGRKRDPKDWARRILAEAAEGTYTNRLGIEYANEALGIKPGVDA